MFKVYGWVSDVGFKVENLIVVALDTLIPTSSLEWSNCSRTDSHRVFSFQRFVGSGCYGCAYGTEVSSLVSRLHSEKLEFVRICLSFLHVDVGKQATEGSMSERWKRKIHRVVPTHESESYNEKAVVEVHNYMQRV